MSEVTIGIVDGLEEAPADGGAYARRDRQWVDIEGAANLQVNRGTAAEVAAYTPLDGEPLWDSENKLLYVGDGLTQGGVAVGRQVLAAYQTTATAIPSSPSTYSNATPVTLSPENSLWMIEYVAAFGEDFTDNPTYVAKIGSFSGLSAIDGFLTLVDGGDNVTHKILDGATASFSSGDGLPAVARITGLVRVTGSSGTLAFGFNGSETVVNFGLARSVLVARRVACLCCLPETTHQIAASPLRTLPAGYFQKPNYQIASIKC